MTQRMEQQDVVSSAIASGRCLEVINVDTLGITTKAERAYGVGQPL